MSMKWFGREACLENTLKYVAAYGALSAFGHRIEEVESRILQGFLSESENAALDFWAVHRILGIESDPKSPELTLAKIAWSLQHHFDSRAWCVGYKMIQGANGNHWSRVVEQVESLGLPVTKVKYQELITRLQGLRKFTRIDAVFVDTLNGIIRPVKGCTFGTLKKYNKRLRDGRMVEPTLFDSADRVVEGVCVDGRAIASLELSKLLLSAAFPRCRIEPVFCVVDDLDSGWHYQVHSIPESATKLLHSPLVQLEELPYLGSSAKIRRDATGMDRLSRLPKFAVSSPLNAVPVNRAARCHMMLDCMWRSQAGEHGLSRMSYGELASEMRKRFLVVYPHDLQRHDMQDCMTMGPTNFARRAFRDNGRRFGITEVGVFETLYLKRLASMAGLRDMEHVDLQELVLSPVCKQARLWRDYDDGAIV